MGPPVTELLQRWSQGDREAAQAAFSALYQELHDIASAYFRGERRDHTLQPTALVHEAFLRLEANGGPEWRSRTQFLAIAARLMRQILVDHARHRNRRKRGGGLPHVPLLEAQDLAAPTPEAVLALDDALRRLEGEDAEKASVVELRFFGGLSVEETAACLGISGKTVSRQWRRARAWLFRELSAGAGGA